MADGTIKFGKGIWKIDLPVNLLEQGSQVVIYTPALELSTSGDTLEQAKQNFHEAVQIFFEDIIGQGVLEDVLDELGWINKDADWTPPPWQCGQSLQVRLAA